MGVLHFLLHPSQVYAPLGQLQLLRWKPLHNLTAVSANSVEQVRAVKTKEATDKTLSCLSGLTPARIREILASKRHLKKGLSEAKNKLGWMDDVFLCLGELRARIQESQKVLTLLPSPFLW